MGSAKNTSAAPARDRKQRIEDMRRAERSRERRGRIAVIAVSTVVVAALIGVGAWAVTKGGDDASSDTADSKSAASGSGHFTYDKDGVGTWSGKLTRNHVGKKVAYPMDPPVGGDHNPVWADCDGTVYTKAVPNENAVHSLEHGAVWVTYNDKAADADVRALAKKVKATPYTLMSPVADQKDPIMLSAWGHQRTVKSASDPAVTQFFASFVQGKQTPELGASCTSGTMQ
ncbi:DUF3105 domain-containing protein [Streptomyces sp. VRA16 Mangrove soil]|uniref:DUF3105 domain-containing protein n=1 Tax=Streptomyces sp. VRA16 Mangrove soil TaxID=2817434 RepID=UPI001A9D3AB1|nr:DUF3105 domain-containing protein [Streptomyces sp. VRA16 Mangrove soil]MBO1333249.1 DUF3105 domain-containing protein [Streptomyces sp. VRA16 Mangrove soil]